MVFFLFLETLKYTMYYLCATLQMLETAPSGVISNRAFCDTIMDMTALTVSAANIPSNVSVLSLVLSVRLIIVAVAYIRAQFTLLLFLFQQHGMELLPDSWMNITQQQVG